MAKQTNKEFAAKNEDFIRRCEAAKVEPTKRQASKFRMGKGKTFKLGKEVTMHDQIIHTIIITDYKFNSLDTVRVQGFDEAHISKAVKTNPVLNRVAK